MSGPKGIRRPAGSLSAQCWLQPGCKGTSELDSSDLFLLPATWEVMRAEVRRLTYKRGIGTVGGFMYCRPRGSWENIRVPLLHVWTMCLGKALRFENLLDGLELGRADGLRRCAA